MLTSTKEYFLLFFGTLILILFPSTLWLEQYFFNVKPIIYLIFTFFILLNSKNIFKFVKNICFDNIKNLDFLIILSILIFFISQGQLNFYALSFLALYFFISTLYITSVDSNINLISIIINSLVFSGLFTLMGIYFGLIESIFFDTTYFHQYQPSGYPNPTSSIIFKLTGYSLSNHISGFQISMNYSAYIIISSLAVINFTSYSPKLINLIKCALIFTLILIQSKVGLLYVAILVSLKIFSKFHKAPKLIFIFGICLGYLFLTHITILESGSEISNTKYYRELAFSFYNLDFYLSLFSWLKLQSINYLASSNFLFSNLDEYVIYANNTDPHSLFFSCIFIGGILFSILLMIKLFSVIFNYFFNNIRKDIFFSTALCALLVESITWDSYDSPIFWLIVFFGQYYPSIMKKISHQK